MLVKYIDDLLSDKKYEINYNIIEDYNLKVISNSQKGLMDNYFSKKSVNSLTFPVIYTIFIIDCIASEIDEDIKKLCINSSLRSKRMSKGYYNLNHFGKEVFLYHDTDKKIFYVLGEVKDCKKVYWSYIIKWIMTEFVFEKGAHIKGTLIEKNKKGILIVGGKSSGKSSLVNLLLKNNKDIDFISNTHIILKNGMAYGVPSCINFRKEMARAICAENDKLKHKVITGCTNLDPIDLNYNIKKSCKIDYIIFYQYNTNGKTTLDNCTEKEMNILLKTYADGINVYSLKDDILDYFKNDLEKIINISLRSEEEIMLNCNNAKNYILSADIFNELSLKKILEIFNDENTF